MKGLKLITEHYKSRLLVIGLLFIVSAVLGSGCSTDVDTKEIPVPFEELLISSGRGGYQISKCYFDTSNIDLNSVYSSKTLSGLEMIIDNPQDLATYVICRDSVTINIDEEFLLGGMTHLSPHGLYVNKQELNLINNNLNYSVEIGVLNTTMPESVAFLIKVPKKYYRTSNSFNIYWKDEGYAEK